MRILVTGAAGFIGAHLARRLLGDGHEVWGIDNFNAYYDVALKRHRWDRLDGLRGVEIDIRDAEALHAVFADARPERVFHFAAQAGVRYSLHAPRDYLSTNIDGTFNVLEACTAHRVGHLVFSSTSSAYGAREDAPFRETDRAAHPVSLYAASKIAGEAIAHSQSHLHDLPISALRFFTVYGPEGRPDMAPHLFTERILAGEPIDVFNHGDMARDFTFIDDLVTAAIRVGKSPPERGVRVCTSDPISPVAPFRTVNIGGSAPTQLLAFIHALESATGKTARIVNKAMQPGDVRVTHADPTVLRALTGYVPQTGIRAGTQAYVDWFRGYYRN